MKRLVFAIAALTLGLGVSAQTIVSTEVQKRNVVIEEYTGVGCTWCPLGHQRVSEYTQEKGADRVVPINIHTGSFSNNTYTTTYGDKIAAQTNLSGYPAASINRVVKSCKINAQTPYNNEGKASFTTLANSILDEDSPVNVAATATVDAQTRKATIKVEIYYTKDMAQPFNLLNVAMLQNNVIGTQTNGGGYNKSQVLEGGKYRHMHMFRDFLTGQWGDTIADDASQVADSTLDSETGTYEYTYVIPAGTFVTTEYVYDIPEVISKEDVVLNDIYFIAFITDGKTEGCEKLNSANIWTGITMEPTFENVPAIDAKIVYLTPFPIYGECNDLTKLAANVRNLGSTAATSIKFNYGVDGKEPLTYTWTGELAPYADTNITMENSFSVILGQKQSIYVEITEINGTALSVKTTSSMKKEKVNEGPLPIKLTLKTDVVGSETSWKVYDSEGNVLHEGGNYPDNKMVKDTVIFDKITADGCYMFEILDSYGDGATYNGSGNYKIFDGEGHLLTSNNKGSWGFGEQRDFKVKGSLGLNEANENIFQSIVYPNPAKDRFTLSVSVVNPSSAVINVVDVMGREVLTLGERSLKSGENQFSINIDNLDDGMYYVRVVTDNGITANKLSVTK